VGCAIIINLDPSTELARVYCESLQWKVEIKKQNGGWKQQLELAMEVGKLTSMVDVPIRRASAAELRRSRRTDV
jgi:hypothetical protein